MTSEEPRYSIGEVARRTGLSAHALRWFEREGLFPDEIERTPGGIRVFSEEIVYWITLCVRLRSTGMPIARLKEFAALVKQGPGNEAERLQLLEAHEAAVRTRVREMQEALAVIAEKSATYRAHLVAGTASGVWEPGEHSRG